MTKTSMGFRLSDAALGHLAQIVDRTGATQTAVVEVALAYLAQLLTAIPDDPAARAAVAGLPALDEGETE
jgi:hypothetical protein